MGNCNLSPLEDILRASFLKIFLGMTLLKNHTVSSLLSKVLLAGPVLSKRPVLMDSLSIVLAPSSYSSPLSHTGVSEKRIEMYMKSWENRIIMFA